VTRRGTSARARRPACRRRFWRAIAALAFGAAVASLAGGSSAGASDGFGLVLDQSQAVFRLTNLRPGPVGHRCIVVTATGGTASSTVLSVTVGGTGLADYLDVVVDTSPTAAAADCDSFTSAAPLFTGTLADLGRQHGSTETALAITLAGGQRAVVRVAVSLRDDNGAMGKGATVALRFDAEQGSVVLSSAGTPTTLAAPRQPGVTSAEPAPTTITAGPDDTVAAPRATGPTGAAKVLATVAAGAVKTAKVASKAGSPAALLFGVMFIFLFVQDRIDRSDPKLALAPLQPEPELEFLPRRTAEP
jgi:hypothetical protein